MWLCSQWPMLRYLCRAVHTYRAAVISISNQPKYYFIMNLYYSNLICQGLSLTLTIRFNSTLYIFDNKFLIVIN
jgi:hypothetical protein